MTILNIDDARASECLLLLKEFFQNNDSLAEVSFPVDIEYASEMWLVYIFYSCLLDYGMRSKVYHKNLIETYKIYPQIFDSKFVVNHYSESREELLILLKENVHPRYPNVAVNKWICLSKELAKYENLKNEVMSKGSFDELSKFIRDMNGYGQKTGGLLIRLIHDSGICRFADEMRAIPLDRHDIEICHLNGIVDKGKLAENEIAVLSTSLIECGKKFGLSPSDVDKYLWEIGNRYCNKKDCLACPLARLCKKKINVDLCKVVI